MLQSTTDQVSTPCDSRYLKYKVIHWHVPSKKENSLLSYATSALNRHLQTITNFRENEIRRIQKSICSSNISKEFEYGSQNSFMVWLAVGTKVDKLSSRTFLCVWHRIHAYLVSSIKKYTIKAFYEICASHSVVLKVI